MRTSFLAVGSRIHLGEDLKTDLKQLNDHYLKLPESEKETGIMRFATHPPETGNYLVAELWDRHLRPWRGKSLDLPTRDPEKDKKLLEHLKKFSKAPTLPPEEVDFDSEDAEMLSIERFIRKRKGSWWQLPKDLKVSDET